MEEIENNQVKCFPKKLQEEKNDIMELNRYKVLVELFKAAKTQIQDVTILAPFIMKTDQIDKEIVLEIYLEILCASTKNNQDYTEKFNSMPKFIHEFRDLINHKYPHRLTKEQVILFQRGLENLSLEDKRTDVLISAILDHIRNSLHQNSSIFEPD